MAGLQEHRIGSSPRAVSFEGPPTASAMSSHKPPPRAPNPDGTEWQPWQDWQPPSAAYSSALLQESGVPAPLLLKACAEHANLIDEVQQSLMHCTRLGAQQISIVCVRVPMQGSCLPLLSAIAMTAEASRNLMPRHDFIQLLRRG